MACGCGSTPAGTHRWASVWSAGLPLHAIVMLTTESHEAKKATGQAAGAKAWMLKPFNPPQLLSVVQRLVLP